MCAVHAAAAAFVPDFGRLRMCVLVCVCVWEGARGLFCCGAGEDLDWSAAWILMAI